MPNPAKTNCIRNEAAASARILPQGVSVACLFPAFAQWCGNLRGQDASFVIEGANIGAVRGADAASRCCAIGNQLEHFNLTVQ
jgi:hypothetical protein